MSGAGPLGDIEDFVECCQIYGWYFSEGWIDLQTAVDRLQWLAEIWGLVDLVGQDEIQQLIAFNTPLLRIEPSEYEANYVARIIAQWEADDARRPTARTISGYQKTGVPQSTVDAFWFVASLGDRDHLANWLRANSDVAAALRAEVA